MDKRLGPKAFTLISGIATVVGLILEFVGGWADEKRMDQTIEEKVHEALEEQQNAVYSNTTIGFADTQSEEP